MALRTGFLAFVEHTGVDAHTARSAGLTEGFRLFAAAEELGYDTGWVRVRHLEPYLSAPLPFLAAVGQRTERLLLGTGVVPIRYENPARLAEEAATTDLLTGGRLQLGLSAGYSFAEGLFGPVFGRTELPFDEEVEQRLRRFLDAVRGTPLGVADARHPHAAEGTPLTAQPLSPTLPDRISYGAGRLATAARTGSLGLGLQLSTLNSEITELSFEDYQARQIATYREARRAVDGADGSVTVGRMILPILRLSDREDYAFLLDRDAQRQRDNGAPGAPPLHFGRVHAGDPDEIVAALTADAALQAADELVVVLPFDHRPEVAQRIVETVARTVLPGLHEALRAAPAA
jgi:alkanesulfonate monooxygenase SsuD/methylene tetrahydromethanopterin reductase-like flavin-dependent oxidoreductase (luciferase family)